MAHDFVWRLALMLLPAARAMQLQETGESGVRAPSAAPDAAYLDFDSAGTSTAFEPPEADTDEKDGSTESEESDDDVEDRAHSIEKENQEDGSSSPSDNTTGCCFSVEMRAMLTATNLRTTYTKCYQCFTGVAPAGTVGGSQGWLAGDCPKDFTPIKAVRIIQQRYMHEHYHFKKEGPNEFWCTTSTTTTYVTTNTTTTTTAGKKAGTDRAQFVATHLTNCTCPQWAAPIQSAELCSKAAEHLGYLFKLSGNSSGENNPPGCQNYPDGKIYFNHGSGSCGEGGVLCKVVNPMPVTKPVTKDVDYHLMNKSELGNCRVDPRDFSTEPGVRLGCAHEPECKGYLLRNDGKTYHIIVRGEHECLGNSSDWVTWVKEKGEQVTYHEHHAENDEPEPVVKPAVAAPPPNADSGNDDPNRQGGGWHYQYGGDAGEENQEGPEPDSLLEHASLLEHWEKRHHEENVMLLEGSKEL